MTENVITLFLVIVVFIGLALICACVEKFLLWMAGASRAEVEEVIYATSDDDEPTRLRNGGVL